MSNRAMAVLVVLLAPTAWWLVQPSPIDPVAWNPPIPPAVKTNKRLLEGMEKWSTGERRAPEDIAVDGAGRVYASMEDGTILRWEEGRASVFADTEGRPLGMHFAADGRLIVADAYKGLLAVDSEGSVESLLTEVGGSPIRFADDVDITADGVVYLSDASARHDHSEWKSDIFEGRGTGRLIRYDLRSGEAEVVLEDLFFANGVALGPDDAFVLVVETSRYRIQRLMLKGPDAGTSGVFANNLPGFPDGVSADGDRFWVALAAPRSKSVDALAPWPWVRSIIARLPQFVPEPKRHPWVLGLDQNASILVDLQEAGGTHYAATSSVERHGDWLYLGSISEGAYARIPAP